MQLMWGYWWIQWYKLSVKPIVQITFKSRDASFQVYSVNLNSGFFIMFNMNSGFLINYFIYKGIENFIFQSFCRHFRFFWTKMICITGLWSFYSQSVLVFHHELNWFASWLFLKKLHLQREIMPLMIEVNMSHLMPQWHLLEGWQVDK